MAWATVNGAMAIACTLSVPRTGIWRASVILDTASAASGPATLVLADGTSTWKGTVFRAGVAFGKVHARLVGGAHGLAGQLSARAYRNAPASIVVADILRDAGETLSSTASASLLGTNMAHWYRRQGSGAVQLQLLVDQLGGTWRVLQDGTVWIGQESWPVAPAFTYDIVGQSPEQGRHDIATLFPVLMPGMNFNGRNVGYVEHDIASSKIRTSIWYES